MSFHISEFIYIFYYPTSDNETMTTWALKGSSGRRERGGRERGGREGERRERGREEGERERGGRVEGERRERGGRVEDNIIFHALHLDVRDTWS